MGMDVSGIKPVTEAGKYFRANIWSWRPILYLIIECENEHRAETGKTSLSDEILKGMSFNDGDGPRTADQVKILSDAMARKVMAIKAAGLDVIHVKNWKRDDVHVDRAGQLKSGSPTKIEESPYSASIEHLEEFVAFLRGCGEGFEVW